MLLHPGRGGITRSCPRNEKTVTIPLVADWGSYTDRGTLSPTRCATLPSRTPYGFTAEDLISQAWCFPDPLPLVTQQFLDYGRASRPHLVAEGTSSVSQCA